MIGRFKGWVRESFGFIEPDDGTPDVFLHINSIPNRERLQRGDRLQFDVVEDEKGRSAANVTLCEKVPGAVQPTRRGRVKTWSPRGFGFIAMQDGGPDIFVHVRALSRGPQAYLSEGDIVECTIEERDKGPVATSVTVVGWEKSGAGLGAFADLGPVSWAEDLRDLAEKEPWDYRHAQATEPLPILRELDPIPWTLSERRIRCPEWDQRRHGEHDDSFRRNSRPTRYGW